MLPTSVTRDVTLCNYWQAWKKMISTSEWSARILKLFQSTELMIINYHNVLWRNFERETKASSESFSKHYPSHPLSNSKEIYFKYHSTCFWTNTLDGESFPLHTVSSCSLFSPPLYPLWKHGSRNCACNSRPILPSNLNLYFPVPLKDSMHWQYTQTSDWIPCYNRGISFLWLQKLHIGQISKRHNRTV